MNTFLKIISVLLLAFAATGCDKEDDTTGRLKVIVNYQGPQHLYVDTNYAGQKHSIYSEQIWGGASLQLNPGEYDVSCYQHGKYTVQVRAGRTTVVRFDPYDGGYEYE